MRRMLMTSAITLLCAAVPFAPAARTEAAPAPVHPGMTAPKGLAPILAKARLATAKYVTSLEAARRDGYTVTVTKHMPDMGWHFLNPKLTGFNAGKPQVLVYVKRGSSWQLVAFEWVFTEKPKKPPLPGATYGAFAAACQYVDGTFVATAAEADCAKTSPETGAAFGFWHPDLVTLHLWAWYPNPDGMYTGMNPLIRPFNT